jgi:hypothetical protein
MVGILNRVAIVLPFAMLLAPADIASAQHTKKLSYAQAWAQCKLEVNKGVPGETANSSGRYAAGGACMHKYGYRLKKSSTL